MEYMYKIKEADLLHLKKKEANVLFLHVDGEIKKNSILYLCNKNKVIGQCVIRSIFEMDIEKLQDVKATESKVINLKNININDYNDENEFFQYLMKGYETWKKNSKNDDFGKYLIYIGYGSDEDRIMAQNNTWNKALMIDKLDIFEEGMSLSYFCDVKKLREEYRREITKCNIHGYYCTSCPYIGACVNTNVNLHLYKLKEMSDDFMECMFIHSTISGLRNIKKYGA